MCWETSRGEYATPAARRQQRRDILFTALLCQGRGTARAVALADDCSVLVTSVECRTHNVVVLVWQYQLQQLLSSAVL